MSKSINPLGSIYITENAIATIASQSAIESYGVVGLAAKNLAEGLSHVLTKDPIQGVDVVFNGEEILIDLHIVVEYGTRIKSVASSVSSRIRYQVEKATGIPVREVNVHIRGLRVSNPD